MVAAGCWNNKGWPGLDATIPNLVFVVDHSRSARSLFFRESVRVVEIK